MAAVRRMLSNEHNMSVPILSPTTSISHSANNSAVLTVDDIGHIVNKTSVISTDDEKDAAFDDELLPLTSITPTRSFDPEPRSRPKSPRVCMI